MTQTQSANFLGIPFVKLQNDTYTTVKRLKTMKNEKRNNLLLLLVELLFSCPFSDYFFSDLFQIFDGLEHGEGPRIQPCRYSKNKTTGAD